MDIDDLELKKPKGDALGQDLSKHSVAELEALIATLRAEISRVEEVLASKQSHKGAAEAAFKR